MWLKNWVIKEKKQGSTPLCLVHSHFYLLRFNCCCSVSGKTTKGGKVGRREDKNEITLLFAIWFKFVFTLKLNPEINIIHIKYVRRKIPRWHNLCSITKLLSSKVGLTPTSPWVWLQAKNSSCPHCLMFRVLHINEIGSFMLDFTSSYLPTKL